MENTKCGWLARVTALLLAFLAAVLLSACAANFYTAADRRNMSHAEWKKVCARLIRISDAGPPGQSPFLRKSTNTMAEAGYENARDSIQSLECYKPWHTTVQTASEAQRTAEWNTANARPDFEKKMQKYGALAAKHYPPRDFESCESMSGRWWGKCLRMDGRKCLEVSRTDGRCGHYVIPVRYEKLCNARKGTFRAICTKWHAVMKLPGNSYTPTYEQQCSQRAAYGHCEAPSISGQAAVRERFFWLLKDGRVVPPYIYNRPGKTEVQVR